MDVRLSRASALIVQRVPPTAVDWFLDWQRSVNEAAEASPGYSGTDVFPPGEGQGDNWVVMIHFEDHDALELWLKSPARTHWLEILKAKGGTFELQTIQEGFGPWFTQRGREAAPPPPAWKMVMTVLLGLFPTVMLLSIFVGPYTSRLGFSTSMLIGNALSVSILQWGVMPILTRVLAPWLNANEPKNKAFSIGGLVLILLLYAVLTALFHLVVG